MSKIYGILLSLILLSPYSNHAAEIADSSSKRELILTTGIASSAAVSLIGINHVWYKNYPKTSFHLFDDFKEWNGMDKVGHVCTSYHLNHYSYLLLKKNGIKKPLLKSSLYTFSYMMGVEFIDGFSSEWGFSIYDVMANGIGSLMYASQQKWFKKQIFKIKFSSHFSEYSSCRPSLLGETPAQQIFKDYNGQTYWLTFNLNQLLNQKINFFNYVDFAVGYSIDGFTGAHENPIIATCPCHYDQCNNLERKSQFLFSLDLNTDKIKSKNKVFKFLLAPFDIVKVPFPAVIINDDKPFRLFYI